MGSNLPTCSLYTAFVGREIDFFFSQIKNLISNFESPGKAFTQWLVFFLSKSFLLVMRISSVEDKTHKKTKNKNQKAKNNKKKGGTEFLCCFLGSHQSPSMQILMYVFNSDTLSTLNGSN